MAWHIFLTNVLDATSSHWVQHEQLLLPSAPVKVRLGVGVVISTFSYNASEVYVE